VISIVLRSTRHAAGWKVGCFAATASILSCSLLVDTGELSGKPDAPTFGAEAGAEAAADAEPEAGTALNLPNPCADTTLVFCESFDSPAALSRFGKDTDPTTNISVDGPASASAPRSARFEILPDTNTSPDATLQFTTTASLSHVAVDGWVLIERSEPAQVGRLFLVNIGAQTNIIVERSGDILDGSKQIGTVAAPPTGRWFRLHVEANGDVVPPTVVVELDGIPSKTITVGSAAWKPGPVMVRFGISEANSPTTGWLVRWDDIRVKSL
jgi:hypothetical protein